MIFDLFLDKGKNFNKNEGITMINNSNQSKQSAGFKPEITQ